MAGPAPSATAPPPEASTAGAVLDELQGRYQKWNSRNLNYSRLLAFLSFVSLLLAVLFLQRSSNTSYQVGGAGRGGIMDPCGCWHRCTSGYAYTTQSSMAHTAPGGNRCIAHWQVACCQRAPSTPWMMCMPG